MPLLPSDNRAFRSYIPPQDRTREQLEADYTAVQAANHALREEVGRLRLALDGIASDVRVRGCEACSEKEQMARVALGGAA